MHWSLWAFSSERDEREREENKIGEENDLSVLPSS
jgi:hypothetical protein